MRPVSLNPYFADIVSLPGIGPKTAPNYLRLLRAGEGESARVLDLALHMPTGLIDRRARPKVRDATVGAIVTVTVRVVEHRAPPRGSRAPYRVVCEDDTGTLTLTFFNAHTDYLKKQLPEGEIRIVSGRL
ncbi:MAG: ATP-dependent DNA helicase RecG, partial [Rhodobiaceae bacterium]|nr:ATP-dependent DNA helicase RecG [Rhodobiaceae bacterium]